MPAYLAYTEGRLPLDEGLKWVRCIAGGGERLACRVREIPNAENRTDLRVSL